MKIASIQIDKNVLIPFIVFIALLTAGCIWWSWAILVGAVLGLLFGMMWAFHEIPED